MISAHGHLDVGSLRVDVALDVAAGEVLAVLGPNGAGKTTIVRALAGLRGLSEGRIVLDGTVVDEPAAGIFVDPSQRSVGVVFQDLLLFPHLDALDNVAFGPRSRGADARTARAAAHQWLERMDVLEVADRRPDRLSGGEAQRVALARALAVEPAVLVMDEPLSALDAGVRSRVRSELRRRLGDYDGAQVLVTHDPMDAMVLADRLMVIEEGRVVQSGTPAEVTARPASPFVAEVAGVNLLRGAGQGEREVRLESGGVLVVAERLPSDAVALAIRPQAVALHLRQPEGSPRNAWLATVAEVEAAGERVRARLAGPVPLVAEVTAGSAADLALQPGTEVWASVKAVDVAVYEA